MAPQPPRPRKILANGQQIILPFLCRSRSARSTNWQSGESHEVHEVHEVRTYTISTSFRLCAVCDAVKTADNRQKNPPVSGGRQSQFPDDDSYFEVLLCPLNLPQEHRKNNSDDGTGCVFVGPRTRTQTFPTWSGLRPDTLDNLLGTR
ncbi:TPA: hypothetical protein PPF24_005266 [Escherichia coli]|nr:hypothetical protein [Escherichia coli]